MKISEIIRITKPEYVYLRLKPNNAIRNQSTHKIARAIASLHRNVWASVKREQKAVKRLIPSYSFQVPSKVSYFIYLEKQKAEFYFIIPRHHLSLIKDKISDVWNNITFEQVNDLPQFSNPTQYQLVYTKEDALSLSVDRRDNDLLSSTLNVIDVMEDGDRVGVFYNFIPVSQFTWRAQYRDTMRKTKERIPVDREMSVMYLFKMTVKLLSHIADLVGDVLGGKKEISGLTQALENINSSQISKSTERKAKATILNTQIVVISESADTTRQRNNARSLAQSFDTVTEDNSLKPRPYRHKINYTSYNIRAAINKVGDEECQNFIALAGRDLLERYNFIDRVETQETEVPEDLRNGVMCIGTNRFRGKEQPAYLSNDREYRNLTTVIIGPTRAGKSTLIGNMSRDAIQAGECVVIFDFVGSCQLSTEVAGLFNPEKALIIDCREPRSIQGLGYNEVGFSSDPFTQYDNAKKQTTQLMTLVNSINSEDTRLTAKMERYLTSAALVVFINGGSIKDVFEMLQRPETRRKAIKSVHQSQRENLSEYIASLGELDDIDKNGRISNKDHLITGVIDRLNKLKANTYMEAMLKKSTAGNIDLVKELQKNQLICLRMPEVMFSTDGERDVYTTYWLTKLWMVLQIREQRIGDRQKLTKVNLVIDELYQVENTQRFLTDKLSRLAKFGLKPIISAHYLNQIKHIREELRSANASYMLISGCDKKNYEELKDELYPFESEDLLKLPRYHSLNLLKCKDGYARFITRLPKPVG